MRKVYSGFAVALGAAVTLGLWGAGGLWSASAHAHGIVNTIVNAPLSASGTVTDARVGINVYLDSEAAPGLEFMDPAVIGFGIAPGGRLEIEMAEGFERDWAVELSQSAIMMVTGAPQQGLPGKAVGYTVGEGDNENTFVITPTGDRGLPAETLMSPAPGAKADPIRQRGLKVIHIGFQQSAFHNRGKSGRVEVRFVNAAGKVIRRGEGTVDFLSTPVAQVLPTNFPDKRRNHNWQRTKSGQTLGQAPGTLPIALMLYDRAQGLDGAALYAFKAGISGAGVLSTQQLKAMDFDKPAEIARYNGGLIVQDKDGDGVLDPAKDRIIGGVIAKAPAGAKGQELRSLESDGKPVLSAATETLVPKAGKRWGGAQMRLQFTAGSLAGKYRPTLALLRDPENLGGGDGSSYTYTIVVE
ncbi:MAG: hypothetical protein ACTSQ7_12210 [Alphaproteobacteria bacterium]